MRQFSSYRYNNYDANSIAVIADPARQVSLNPNTGSVILISRLDYTISQYYLLRIIVTVSRLRCTIAVLTT